MLFTDRAVWTSPDGSEWVVAPQPEEVFQEGAVGSVVGGGPGYVAVGGLGWEDSPGAAVWTSTDGTDWERVHDDNTEGAAMTSVAVGGPGLVAVGRVALDVAVWTSPDGTTWQLVPHDGTLGQGIMHAVIADGSGLVGVGYAKDDDRFPAAVWTSPDGTSWTRVPHDPNTFGPPRPSAQILVGMYGIAAGDSGLVAVGGVDDFANSRIRAAVWVGR